jgi:hypothetical protein
MTDVRNKSRQDRLRKALRENLKRRKQQAKGRASAPAADAAQPDEADNSAGEDQDVAEKPR